MRVSKTTPKVYDSKEKGARIWDKNMATVTVDCALRNVIDAGDN